MESETIQNLSPEWQPIAGLIREFLDQLARQPSVRSNIEKPVINQLIAEIDVQPSIQLTEIIHHQDFQKLEASWRVHYVLTNAEPSSLLRVLVMHATKQEILKDFERSLSMKKSALFDEVANWRDGG